jgi:cytochrome oxidase Cu insertion factor (SCO1/SenC/PrrC family)
MFSVTVDNILQALQMPPVSVEVDQEEDPLADLKEFIVEYNHESHAGSPVLDQIMNASTIEEIEQYLKVNFDYCEDCLLKMYRKYATKN